MIDINAPQAAQWLYTLQQPWPLTPRPLKCIAEHLENTTEDDLVAFIQQLREQGVVRRIGGVFDARQLGYRSCLFAITAKDKGLEQAAAEVAALPGVTHVYTRGWPKDYTRDGITHVDYEHFPNLWYTLSARADTFDEEVSKLAHWSPRAFPAIKRFKIDVVFDTRTRQRDERTEYKPNLDVLPATIPTEEQQTIIRRYQGDTNTPDAPFLNEDLPQLKKWFDAGIMRRYALLLRHRATGFTANAMCCWSVPETMLNDVGRTLAADADVTHCYARPQAPDFPFSIYAMVHKTSWDEAYETFQRLSRSLPKTLSTGRVFFSTREFKKTSLSFFL
jgi:DNA-binding Lrp family transcriptional regulator